MDSFGCSECTLSQATLAADRQASGGIVSPVNGTVTLWRIRAGGSSTPTALRIIKPLGGGLFTGGGTSATVTPALNATSVFSTQLPIAIGDAIGIDCCQPVAEYFLSSGGTLNLWNPVLADGGSGRANEGPGDQHEMTLNAEIEPTSTFQVTGSQRSKHGKLLVTANLPNPGTLAAGDRRATVLSAAAAKKKKPKLLKRSSVQVGAPTSTQLRVLPTKTAKAELAQGKKVKAGLKLSFTPTGGTASTQLIKLKLRP
jgi:hypothetical protein